MNAVEYDRDTHEINDVLTQLKGLVLVQPILEARGVSNEELERHTGEIVPRCRGCHVRSTAIGVADRHSSG